MPLRSWTPRCLLEHAGLETGEGREALHMVAMPPAAL